MANIERQTPHISQYAIHARARIKRKTNLDPSMDHVSTLQHTKQHNKHLNLRYTQIQGCRTPPMFHRRGYGDNRPTKSYPKRKLLPEFDEEALDPPQAKIKIAIWLDRRPHGQHRAANTAHKPIRDPREGSHQKEDEPRSIYGPRKHAPAHEATQQTSKP